MHRGCGMHAKEAGDKSPRGGLGQNGQGILAQDTGRGALSHGRALAHGTMPPGAVPCNGPAAPQYLLMPRIRTLCMLASLATRSTTTTTRLMARGCRR